MQKETNEDYKYDDTEEIATRPQLLQHFKRLKQKILEPKMMETHDPTGMNCWKLVN